MQVDLAAELPLLINICDVLDDLIPFAVKKMWKQP